MLVIALMVTALWGLFNLLKILYDVVAKKLISQALDAERATQIRRKLLKIRKYSLYIILCGIFIGYTFFICMMPEYGSAFMPTFLIFLGIVFTQIVYEKSKTRLYGNISYISADELLTKDEEFYLYLRGFENDVPFKGSSKLAKGIFKESLLAEAVEYGVAKPLYALGMTKEIDAPEGALRIYVNDHDWRENVLLLMQKAKQIFILVNNRESCLWEIEQAKSMQDKLIFIVDDLNEYKEIYCKYGDVFNMPNPPEYLTHGFFFRCNGEVVGLGDTLSDYMTILNLKLEEVEAEQLEERKELHRKSNIGYAKKILKFILSIIIILFVIMFVILVLGFLVA